MDSSLGARAEQNAEQNDVINNICNKDFVNKKKSGMLNALKSSKMPVSTCQNNQTTSHILDKTFIAQFKEKRRRLLLEQLRNMRGKEKIGSCAIILAQLEKLKRDVRKLSAAKLRRTNGASTNNRCGAKSQSKESTKKNEVQSTQNAKQHLDYETIRASVKDIACENTTKTYPRLLWKAVDVSVHDSSMRKNLGESSDYNPMSMETSDSDVPTVNDTSKRHDDIQLPNEICDVFRQGIFSSLSCYDCVIHSYNYTITLWCLDGLELRKARSTLATFLRVLTKHGNDKVIPLAFPQTFTFCSRDSAWLRTTEYYNYYIYNITNTHCI